MLSDSFAFYIGHLRRDFINFCSRRLGELGVTYGQLFVLLQVGRRDECTPKEVSQALRLDAGQLNRTLARLAEGGFLTQRKSEADRRVTLLQLTDRGREVIAASRALFREWDEQTLAPLAPDERERLLEQLKRAVAGLRTERKDMEHEQAFE